MLILNTGKETAKEKEGKIPSFVIFGYAGIQFQPREPESVANNRVLSQTWTRSPPSLQPDLTFLGGGGQLGPQEEPPDQMAFANFKLPLVPSRNSVSWGPKRI